MAHLPPTPNFGSRKDRDEFFHATSGHPRNELLNRTPVPA